MTKVKNKARRNLSDRAKVKVKKSTNPFEVHVNRQKFSVIGRTLKHDKGLPGVARSKAFTKRKATLLREYQVKNKSNKFMDQRIGEGNKYMSDEDKWTARFVAERMKEYKNSVYNLAQGEVLTHRGHALSEIEKFDDPKSDDEDDDGRGKLDAKFVSDAHFGGFLKLKEETESQAKSRKELIDQLIAESKKRRYEKQKEQDETLEMTDKLDSLWKDLLPVVSLGNSVKNDPEKTVEGGRPKVDPYDLAVQELKFEARGKPSEKLKTEEEIAAEEKEKLEKLECDRLRRMQGFLDEKPASLKHRSADDLDDGFALENVIEDNENPEPKMEAEEQGDVSDSGEVSETDNKRTDDENEDVDKDQESDMEEDGETGEESGGESSEDDFSDLVLESSTDEEEGTLKGEKKVKESNPLSSDEIKPAKEEKKTKMKSKESDETAEKTGDEEMVEVKEKKAEVKSEQAESLNESKSNLTSKVREELLRRKKIMDKAREELPYTYEVPGNFDDFAVILKGLSPEHQSVVLERMIKCTHPSLKSGNKQHLENLFAHLLQHINDCPYDYEESPSKESTSRSGYCFSVLRNIMPHMYDLAQISPENATYCVASVIKEKFEELKGTFPGLETLLFLKMIPQLFPASDFRHPVCTPAIIMMTHALRSCKVKSRLDVATGLFISTLMLEYSRLSKRFSPELVNFLLGIFYLAIPKAQSLPVPPQPPMFTGKLDDRANLLVIVKNPLTGCSDMPELVLEAEDLEEKKNDALFRVRALGVASQLAISVMEQLKDLPSCKDVFIPFINLIPLLPLSAYPQPLLDSIKVLENSLKDLMSISTPMERLAHAAKRPKALKLYEPAIEDVFDGQKRRNLSRERSEREKLVHKYKKEMKGAIREIRRDKDFLAKVKVKETLRNDMQRIAKVKEIFGTAALQQGELRKMTRKK